MAIAIKTVPILKKDEAKTFIKKADDTVRKGSTVDFTDNVKRARAILKKAGM